MKTIQPRKQRKRYHNAPQHKKQKWLASHLAENLLLKYDRRSMPVIKGDTVKVIRGSYKGHEDKIVRINTNKQFVHIEGLTLIKADGTKIPKPIHPSNLLVTKLNLTNPWRRKILEKGLSETVKKEIEIEAKQQVQEAEAERAKKEEAEITEDYQAERIEEEQKPDEEIQESSKLKEKTKVEKKETTKKESAKDKPREKTLKKTDQKSQKKTTKRHQATNKKTKTKSTSNKKKEESK